MNEKHIPSKAFRKSAKPKATSSSSYRPSSGELQAEPAPGRKVVDADPPAAADKMVLDDIADLDALFPSSNADESDLETSTGLPGADGDVMAVDEPEILKEQPLIESEEVQARSEIDEQYMMSRERKTSFCRLPLQ